MRGGLIRFRLADVDEQETADTMTEGAIRHAVDGDGRELLNRKLPREKVLGFLAAIASCDVALEACSSSIIGAAPFFTNPVSSTMSTPSGSPSASSA